MVQDLETRHQKVRQQYEEEIQALRAEVQALRSAPPPPPALPAPPSQLGLSLPSGGGPQGHPANGGLMPGIERTGPGAYQGELYDRDSDRLRDRGDDRGRDMGRKVLKEERPGESVDRESFT